MVVTLLLLLLLLWLLVERVLCLAIMVAIVIDNLDCHSASFSLAVDNGSCWICWTLRLEVPAFANSGEAANADGLAKKITTGRTDPCALVVGLRLWIGSCGELCVVELGCDAAKTTQRAEAGSCRGAVVGIVPHEGGGKTAITEPGWAVREGAVVIGGSGLHNAIEAGEGAEKVGSRRTDYGRRSFV